LGGCEGGRRGEGYWRMYAAVRGMAAVRTRI
jgi:hypothetical protein